MAVTLDKGKGLVKILAEEYAIRAERLDDGAVRVFVDNVGMRIMTDCLIAANTMYRWTIAIEDTTCETIIMRRRDEVTMALRAIERATFR